MLPPTMLVPHDDLRHTTPTPPDIQRMDMFNRARREELDMMINGTSSDHAMTFAGKRRTASEPSTISRLVNGLRKGIGNALVTAGTRMQSPA